MTPFGSLSALGRLLNAKGPISSFSKLLCESDAGKDLGKLLKTVHNIAMHNVEVDIHIPVTRLCELVHLGVNDPVFKFLHNEVSKDWQNSLEVCTTCL